MATLTRLDAPHKGIGNLTGLEFATNLRFLNINNNLISDISPLSGLTNLHTLLIAVDFGKGKISDFSPLAALTNLEVLSAIGHPQVSDISPLSGLTNLRRLSLPGPNILDLSPLSGLTKIASLSIDGGGFSDLSPLAEMTDMEYLELPDANISDISPLADMTEIYELNLQLNNISDLSPLAGLTQLHWLFLDANSISDLAPLVANTGLDSGDEVGVTLNLLNAASINTHIPALQARGVKVSFDEVSITVDGGPQIYNDNVFCLARHRKSRRRSTAAGRLCGAFLRALRRFLRFPDDRLQSSPVVAADITA